MRSIGLVLAMTLALPACTTSPSVNYDFDPSANLAAYSTYNWANVTIPAGMNPLLFDRVKASIDSYLKTRGFTPSENAQFAVGFTLGRRDRVEVDDFGVYGPYYRGWSAWSTTAYSQLDVRHFTDGTLVIDIYDTATKRPVWHGKATKEIRPSQVDQALIDQGVAAVLAKFPPPAS